MWFWWFILFSDLIIPVIMLVAGRMMQKRPPQKINCFFGYRTERSMKNRDTWEFAHKHCGKLWWKLGWILLLPSLLIHLPIYGQSEQIVGTVSIVLMIVQLIVLVASLFPTEQALKNTFTDSGKRK